MVVKIISMFRTLVHFFPLVSRMVRVSVGKFTYSNDLKGKKNYFELAGGSSSRGFELPRVKLQ